MQEVSKRLLSAPYIRHAQEAIKRLIEQDGLSKDERKKLGCEIAKDIFLVRNLIT